MVSIKFLLKYYIEIVFVVIGALILIVNYIIIVNTLPFLVPILNVVGGLVAVVPPILVVYSRYKTSKEIEQQFMVFIRDLTDAINSGMTLPMALSYCSKRNYMALSPHINSLASQVEWGIPFEKTLKIFSKKVPAITIRRAVTTIIEAYKVGGKISNTLSSIGRSLLVIDKIKKERTASVHTQIITSYLIYFVFIFILVTLQTFLIPALEVPITTPGISFAPEVETANKEMYTQSFINFIMIQGFFAGLVTGKMAEGSVIAGMKHSLLLIVIGYTIFSLAVQFQIVIS